MKIPVIDEIVQKNNQPFPIVDANNLRGGFYQVTTEEERESIPSIRFKEGMLCYVTGTQTYYRLENSKWVAATFGSDLELGTTSTTAFAGDRGKALEDLVNATNLPVANPILTVTNTLLDNNGDKVTNTPSDFVLSNNVVVETGYKVNTEIQYKWQSDSSHKNPTAVSGIFSTLTKDGELSDAYTSTVSTNTTYTVTLSAPKTGLMVSGTSVVKATGVDSSSASVKYTFNHRIYYGATVDTTDITTLSSKLSTTKAITLSSVSADKTQYYVFAYPKSLGQLSTIIQNGATPVLTAFTQSEKTITNSAGVDIDYYVYVSNNVGAFTDVILEFK